MAFMSWSRSRRYPTSRHAWRTHGMEPHHADAEEYLAPIAMDLHNRGVKVDVRLRRGRR